MSKRSLPRLFALLAMLSPAGAVPPGPAWWSAAHASDPATPTTLDVSSAVNANTPNNKGPANIGQAKHMARSALLALRASGQTQMANGIEAALVGPPDINNPSLSPPLASWAPPTTPPEQEKQKAPLLVGQLKAIAAPFYDALHTAAPLWLDNESENQSEKGQLQLNGTKDPDPIHTDHYYPWTFSETDDQNESPATIGQLKAVFSLRFESLDLDHDGLPDVWEAAEIQALVASDPVRWAALGAAGTMDLATSYWGDGWTAAQSYALGFTGGSRQLSKERHSDSDGVPDAEDADPLDTMVDWPPAAEVSYAAIELDQLDYTGCALSDASFDPTNFLPAVGASIGKGGTVLWKDRVKDTNAGRDSSAARYRVWKNGSWTTDITKQPTKFTNIPDMSTTYVSVVDFMNDTSSPLSLDADCTASTPYAVCGDLILGTADYHGSKDDLAVRYIDEYPEATRNDGSANVWAVWVPALWTLGADTITANPIDPPKISGWMTSYFPRSSAPLAAIGYRPLASPGGALASLGTPTTQGEGLWKIWNPPSDASPYVPGQGAPTAVINCYDSSDNRFWINAIEDGGVVVGYRAARFEFSTTYPVANDHGVESKLPCSEGSSHAASAICRVPTAVSGQSRLVAAGTDLWVQKDGQWSISSKTPSVGTVLAIAKDGVLLGSQAIWRNGKEISLDSLVANQKIAGPDSAARYTKLIGYAMNGEDSIVALAEDALHPGPDKKTLILLQPVEVEEVIEPEESAGCTGYDKDENALMVPMEGSNKIKVKIAGAPADLLAKMKFIAEPAGKLTIAPEVPTAAEQELTLSGTAAALGVKVKLEIDGAKVDLFEADVLKKRTEKVYIHVVKEAGASDWPITPDATQWKEYTNKIYNSQTNVFFDTVTLSRSTSAYDFSPKDGYLGDEVYNLGGHPQDELEKVVRDVPKAVGYINNYYIVDKYAFVIRDNSGNFLHFEHLGAATYFEAKVAFAIDDPYEDLPQEYTFAHELGHQLGMRDHSVPSEGKKCLMNDGDSTTGGKEIKRQHWRDMNP